MKPRLKKSTMQHEREGAAGFTLVEMLVVIGILGILASVLIGSVSHLKRTARKSQAQSLVSDVATAFNLYLQLERKWPTALTERTEMDEEACWVFQKKNLLDVTTMSGEDSNGEPILNEESLDRFGLLSPWGRDALKRNPTISSAQSQVGEGLKLADHRLQYRLDLDYDGYVDSSEGSPEGIRIRACAIVWSRGPDGQDDFDSNNPRAQNHYPYDDSLSWSHARARADQ